jgi:hypothetical protein
MFSIVRWPLVFARAAAALLCIVIASKDQHLHFCNLTSAPQCSQTRLRYTHRAVSLVFRTAQLILAVSESAAANAPLCKRCSLHIVVFHTCMHVCCCEIHSEMRLVNVFCVGWTQLHAQQRLVRTMFPRLIGSIMYIFRYIMLFNYKI